MDIQFGHVDWGDVLKGTLLYYPNLLLIVVSTHCASAFFKIALSQLAVSLDQPYSVYQISFYEETLGKFAPKGVDARRDDS
ncbi:hypothetical protein ACEQPO_00780 [Bacillus sp. SL00103]